ncbi:MAG: cbb3-type cytochrome oxidase assembly protein CcoS [Acidobacteriota bacterium]|nr:cbb3-type cytochrome oxidase assembly protein CcoS [Acidobacteriota bacterium]
MSAVYIALPFALLLALLFLAAFIWSVKSGQIDDLETPAHRILGEDEERKPPTENRENSPEN